MFADRRQWRQARQLGVQVQAFELVGFGQGQGLVRVAWQQPGQLVGADFLRQAQGGEFFLQVDRLAEVVQAEDQRRVLGLPVFRAVATLRQWRRQLVAVAEHISVDPAGIHLEETLEAWRGIGVQLVGAGLEVGRAHQAVDFQHIGAGHFRQATLSQQAHADHLADTVTGVDVTQGEQCVVEVARFDQRHAHGVAAYRNILRQALERLYAGTGQHAVTLAGHLAATQAEQPEQRSGYAEPGGKRGKGWRGHVQAPAGRGGKRRYVSERDHAMQAGRSLYFQ
ncbi:hypothetical protein D3C85_1015850 [compost metagenome]